MIDRLFVYGTLAPGRSNAHVLADVAGTWEPATVRGRLLPQGWGAAAGWPGIIPDPRAGEVRGLVFSSPALRADWPRLDEFEGPGYQRVLVSAKLDTGSEVQAYVYALSSTPPETDGS
ncbi:gamma-glutamylcyclotransferase [Ramlibacter tataouinensis]|uniref:gamma-glutamylcyclotransferase family protein n=1 Tax=Ramlibacter tataouinensis TaxID=94132 RepID=UPI0022F39F91|nr:gamma-glutamylcyclotransferase family protein [Ramlibacter tataouinensis]WBY01302.1 gamma-glutamylcyclotransferase [Ramlibacter tataouinensis]